MRVGIMTGGGDCPGLNAIIQTIVYKCHKEGDSVVGIFDGYKGLLNGEWKDLSTGDVEDILDIGGTILRSSRVNPVKTEENVKKALDNFKRTKIDALITIGGDDTLGAAFKLSTLGVPIIGIPKTVDNDLLITDYCVGFQTAVEIATQSIRRLHTTAKSHKRVIIVEVMGRYAGWLTLMAGLAGGAHIILIPEKPFSIEEICRIINEREVKEKTYTIIAVAEGATPETIDDIVTLGKKEDAFGHKRLGGIAKVLEKEIAERTGKETRSVVLGHVQRGGTPIAFDRILGIRLALKALELIKKGTFGHAVCIKGLDIISVPLEKMVEKQKRVPLELFELTNNFNGI